jgi:hypothetical protein
MMRVGIDAHKMKCTTDGSILRIQAILLEKIYLTKIG